MYIIVSYIPNTNYLSDPKDRPSGARQARSRYGSLDSQASVFELKVSAGFLSGMEDSDEMLQRGKAEWP